MATAFATDASAAAAATSSGDKYVIPQVRRLKAQKMDTPEFLESVIGGTVSSRAIRTRESAKAALQAISGYGYSIQLQLRLFVLQLFVIFADINSWCGDISIFGGFVREFVREKHQPGSGYFDSDLDVIISYENLSSMLKFLRRCNLDIKLESFNRDLLSIVIHFQNGDHTYKVPVDFVTNMVSGAIDFDVNNLSMRLSHQFDMSRLVSSGIDTIGELLLPKVSYLDSHSLSSDEYVKGSIQAIVNGVATLEYDESGRMSRYRSDVYSSSAWVAFLAKVMLCRAPKIMARGFKVDMEQLPVFHTQAELDAQTPDTEDPIRCPYCLDDDDKDQMFVTLACCGNKVHASCHFEFLMANKRTLETFKCCMCRQSKGIQMQETATDFLTSSDEFEKLMFAVEDMRSSVRGQDSRQYTPPHLRGNQPARYLGDAEIPPEQVIRRSAAERVRDIRERYRRRGTRDYST
jgi:hypothetical protein